MPGDQLGKFNLTVMRIEFTAERQMAFFERELLKLRLVHESAVSRCKGFGAFSGFSLHTSYKKYLLIHYHKTI